MTPRPASERLRELDGALSPVPLVTNRSGVFLELEDWRRLKTAFPLVIDVVETAETVELRNPPGAFLDSWGTVARVSDALTALREALEEK